MRKYTNEVIVGASSTTHTHVKAVRSKQGGTNSSNKLLTSSYPQKIQQHFHLMTTRLGRGLGRRGQGGVGDARGMRGRHGVPGRGGRRGPAPAHAGEGWPGIHARPRGRGRGRWHTGPVQGSFGGRRVGDEVAAHARGWGRAASGCRGRRGRGGGGRAAPGTRRRRTSCGRCGRSRGRGRCGGAQVRASEQGARAGERAGATSRRRVGDDVDLNLAKGVICWGMARLVPAGLTSRH